MGDLKATGSNPTVAQVISLWCLFAKLLTIDSVNFQFLQGWTDPAFSQLFIAWERSICCVMWLISGWSVFQCLHL